MTKKLNFANLDEKQNHRAPIQTKEKGVVKEETTRTSFWVDEDLYRRFKTYAVKHDILIKDLFEAQIKYRIESDSKVNKRDYEFQDNSDKLKKQAFLISKSLNLKLKIWLDKYDIYLKDFLVMLIKNILKED